MQGVSRGSDSNWPVYSDEQKKGTEKPLTEQQKWIINEARFQEHDDLVQKQSERYLNRLPYSGEIQQETAKPLTEQQKWLTNEARATCWEHLGGRCGDQSTAKWMSREKANLEKTKIKVEKAHFNASPESYQRWLYSQ